VARKVLRVLKLGALIIGGFVLLIGAEVLLIFRRDFPLADPEGPIRGEFGDTGLPTLRFVVLGDSTSVGVGTTPDKSFPWVLATRLSERFHVILEVVGKGGATVRDLAEEQVPKALALKPDLILVEAGANDTTHVTPPWVVRSRFSEALDRLMEVGVPLVVAGPPDMGAISFMAQPLRALAGLQSDKVTSIIESEAERRGLPYVDLQGGVRNAKLPPGFRYYSSDEFHPGEGGYGLWAEVMYPAVLEAALASTDRRTSAPGDRAAG
jgi:lysophospholipase L1-like esterase